MVLGNLMEICRKSDSKCFNTAAVRGIDHWIDGATPTFIVFPRIRGQCYVYIPIFGHTHMSYCSLYMYMTNVYMYIVCICVCIHIYVYYIYKYICILCKRILYICIYTIVYVYCYYIYTCILDAYIYISQFFVSCRLQKRFLALHPRSGSSASRWQVSLTPWTLPVKRRGRVASCLTAVIVAAKLGHYSPTLWLGKLMITQYSTEVHK
jgi:hypothetical protein